MGGRRLIRTAVTVLLLTAAACSSSAADKAAPGATVPTEPVTTTTTNPYAVPRAIDAAYVNRVLAALDAVVGDAVRIVVATRNLPPEALDRLRAVYADTNRLQRSIDGFQRDIREGLTGYKPNPGNKTSVVVDLLTATPSCIFASVQRNYSEVSTNTSALRNPQWIELRPVDSMKNAYAYNPTPWAYGYDGFPPDVSQVPPDPCKE